VREEDDELLRAAEELGIDLSPASVRQAAAEVQSAQEVEEGAPEEGADATTVASDENLAEEPEELAPVDGESEE
jgi:hypothetical protein